MSTTLGPQSSSLDIKVLGAFSVSVNGGRISDSAWKLKKAKAVVKLLAVADHHRLPRDIVLEKLWPELPPDAALNNLHKAIFVARRALEPNGSGPGSFIRFQDDVLSLGSPGELRVDARLFEELASEASASGTLGSYRSAIAQYGGHLLPDDLYEDWAVSKRDELRRTYLDLLLEYADLAQASGRLEEAVQALQQAVSTEPELESAHARLMTLFTQQGDRHRAIRQYQALTQVLKSEFGIEPQPSTRELYDSIIGGRVALARSSRPEPAPAAAAADASVSTGLEAPPFRPSGGPVAGRQAELQRLEPRLRSFLAGEGSVILVSGPAGVGKSRLAQELAAEASSQGAFVLKGGAYEFERQIPYGPFSEAFDDFIGSLPSNDRHRLVDSAPIDVYPLLPRTAQEMGLRQAVTEGHDREYLFAAVETFLRSLAKSAPVVLIADDLHAADGATLELFHFLARKAGDFPLLLIATYRSEDEAVSRDLSRVLATLGRIGEAERISLDHLDRRSVEQIVQETLGGPVAADLVESVYSASEGNPLFAEEVARAMQESGAIDRDAEAWRLVSALGKVPEAVSQLLNDRFDRLSDEGRQLLSVAAVIGIETSYPLLRSASGMDEEPFLDALDELLGRHIVVEHDDGYRFSHNLHRAVALEGLSRARQRKLHTDVAHAVLELRLGGAEEFAESLAFHFLESNERTAAIPHLISAGRRAARLFANERALELFTSAHDLLLGREPDTSPLELGAVLEAMGDVHARIGNAARSLALFKQAMAVLEPVDAEAGIRARGKAALAAINAEQVSEGGELLRSVLASISPDTPEQSLSRTYLLLAQLEWHSAEHRGALEAAEKALEAALSSGDKAEAARAYEALALSCHSLGDWQKGIEYELSRSQTDVPGFDSDTAFDAHL